MLTDALLVGQGERGHDLGRRSPHVLVRSLAVVEGQFTAVSSLCPRGDFGRSAPVWSTTGSALTATVGAAELTLCGPPPDKVDAPGAHWRRDLVAGQRLTFTLLFGSEQQSTAVWSEAHALAGVLETKRVWQSWSATSAADRGALVPTRRVSPKHSPSPVRHRRALRPLRVRPGPGTGATQASSGRLAVTPAQGVAAPPVPRNGERGRGAHGRTAVAPESSRRMPQEIDN